MRMKAALGGIFGLEPVREAVFIPSTIQEYMKRLGMAFTRARTAVVEGRWSDLEKLAADAQDAAEKLRRVAAQHGRHKR